MMALQGIKFLNDTRQRNQAYAIKKQQAEQNRVNAAQARDLKIQQLSAQANQTAALYAQRKQENAIQALKAQESIVNSATYAGNNLNLRVLDVERQRLNADTAYSEQNAIDQRAIEFQSMGIDAEMYNRIASVQAGQQPPSLGMTLLEGAATMYAADYMYSESSSDRLFGTIFQSKGDGSSNMTIPVAKEIEDV